MNKVHIKCEKQFHRLKVLRIHALERPRVSIKIDHIRGVYLPTSDVSLSSVKLRLSDVKFSAIKRVI